MKPFLITLFCTILALQGNAQIGEAIKFEYDGAGQRIKRYYNPSTWLKPGKKDDQQADTIIGYYKKDDTYMKESDYFMKAYPNPVHDVLYIENISWEEGNVAVIKLMDVAGKEILSKRTTQSKDNIQFPGSVTPGSYHVSYYLNGTFLISWPIVKL